MPTPLDIAATAVASAVPANHVLATRAGMLVKVGWASAARLCPPSSIANGRRDVAGEPSGGSASADAKRAAAASRFITPPAHTVARRPSLRLAMAAITVPGAYSARNVIESVLIQS